MSQTTTGVPGGRGIFGAALRGAAVAAVVNAVVWLVGNQIDSMKVDLAATIAASIVTVLAGGAVYALLARATKRVNATFTVVSVVFTLLSAAGPISAMSSAPMPGMALFNTTTMIATELMHVVAAVAAIWAYTRSR